MSGTTGLLTRSMDVIIDEYDGFVIRRNASGYEARPKGTWHGENLWAPSLPLLRKAIREWWDLLLPAVRD